MANLSKHLVHDGQIEVKPFEGEDAVADSGLSNAYVSAIYCVSSSVSLPYDLCLTCFDSQLYLQAGDMQRTPSSLIPLYRCGSKLDVYLKSVCPDPSATDAYLIGKYLCLPHTHTTISPADALGFARDAVMEHVSTHKRQANLLILSNACVWMPLLYKCAAYLVQTKKQSVDALINRTSNYWYVLQDVFDQSCDMAEEMRDKNKLLDASNMSFTLARADGTLWYDKMRCKTYFYCIVTADALLSDEEYAKPLHITLGLQFHVSVPS